MNAVIHSIAPDTPASRVDLRPGDRVLAINGQSDLEDMFDYQFAVADEDTLDFTIERDISPENVAEKPTTESNTSCRPQTETLELLLEKDADDDPGITFTSPVFTPIKTCKNACPFCFIDQQPKGLRPNLYLKDDDWRLSYFSSTYITMTNLTARDRQRIEQIRPGPLHVSVHSTVPHIREQLLKNTTEAGHIMRELRWLADLGIPFHCQVVVCPGINDNETLTQTLNDLHSLKPEALSVAVIPVGLTNYRDNLPTLQPIDKAVSAKVIAQVKAFEESVGDDQFVYLSDEFYYKAEQPLPIYCAYGEFGQLDDGVGPARALLDDFYKNEATLPKSISPHKNVLIVTGKLAAMTLAPIMTRLNEIDGFYIDCNPIESNFWGEQIDVAGVITGSDILNALKSEKLSGYAFAVIPGVMLKEDTELFLDGKTVTEIATALNLPFKIVQNAYSAQTFLQVLGLT